MVSTFDPAAHLHKQGWKGKGTALKQGHATRPLAVVQKKSLSGIGKDRDEAVPFWDQIFAATAASIFSPSPSVSGTSSPIPQRAAHSSTRDWITTSYSAPGSGSLTPLVVRQKKGGAPSTQARVGKEMARKGLYSRFLRGKVIVVEPEEEEAEAVAGPSTVPLATTSAPISTEEDEGKGKRKDREGETKEERKIRRAEKARRKAEKAAVSSSAISPIPDGEGGSTELEKKRKKKRKAFAEEAGAAADEMSTTAEATGGMKEKKRKKKGKEELRKDDMDQAGNKGETKAPADGGEVDADRKKKKKRRKDV